MFSEYASKYLPSSQRSAPLFNGGTQGDSDVDDYLEAVSGSTDGSYDTNSESDVSNLENESDEVNSPDSINTANPPSELLIEHPTKRLGKRKPKQKHGYSLWQKNVEDWRLSFPKPSSSKYIPSGERGTNLLPTIPDGPITYDRNKPPTRNSPVAGAPDPEIGIVRSKPIDNTIAGIYLISMALSLTTAILVSISASPSRIGNIYPIFVKSARSLVVYAVLSTIISVLWLFSMRYFTRVVVQTYIFAVPTVLSIISVSSIAMSIHYNTQGWHGMAHAAMRLSALIPLGFALLWILYLRRVKDYVNKAADMVVLSAEVYNQCSPYMICLTIVSGTISIALTGIWSFFLAKAFLEGKVGILLVLWFSFMYLWTWGIFCSLLRAVLAMVTEFWYAVPHPPKNTIIQPVDGLLGTSIYKAVTFHFSSICLSVLVALLVRIPLIILPRRLSDCIIGIAAMIFSASVSRLLNPLTLPTSVIEKCSLSDASKLVGSPLFIEIDMRPYRLAKLFLVAGRLCCSLFIGFIAWIHADRVHDVSSVHGYLIAIVAWCIGWTIMGASENMLSMINDALVVCYVFNTESPKRMELLRLLSNEPPEHEQGDNIPASEYSD